MEFLGKNEEAMKYYHIALKAFPNDPILFYNLATVYENEGESKEDKELTKKAVLLYKKALSLSP